MSPWTTPLFLALLIPLQIFAQGVNSAEAVPSKLFERFEGVEHYNDIREEVLVSNMPAFKNQGVLGICSGCAASIILQKYICDVKKIARCADINTVDPRNSINILAMHSLNQPIDPAPQKRYESSNYERLDVFAGGNAFNILNVAIGGDFAFYTDKCYAYDKFADTYQSDARQTILIFHDLKKSYQKYRQDLLEKIPDLKKANINDAKMACPYCLRDLSGQMQKYFFKEADSDALLSGLSMETFEGFLFKIFFGECSPNFFWPTPKSHGYFPDGEKEKVSRNQAIERIKGVLYKNRPVAIDGLCSLVYKKDQDICIDTHSLVISGYMKVCNKTACRQLFRVHNCEGEIWQKKTGGWFDGETLLDQQVAQSAAKETINGKTYMRLGNRGGDSLLKPYTISWINY
jgi:hypothetical protein